MKKPAIIQKLEKNLGFQIEQKPSEDELTFNSYYTTNSQNQVVSLSIIDREVNPIWLSGFTNLMVLTLYNCKLSDISSLGLLDQLTFLNIGGNKINDISPLRHLVNLKYLYINSNEVIDLSPLYNQLKSGKLSILKALNNPLEYPTLDVVEIGTDATFKWFENNLKAARFLINECLLSGETRLDLGNLGLTDLALLPELFKCVHLKELILSNNWILHLEGDEMKYNYSVNRGKPNNISDIPPEIVNLTNLESLIIAGSWFEEQIWRIQSFEPFQKMKSLKRLDIGSNSIQGPINIGALTQLEEFICDHNKITNITSHYHLKSLKHIYLGGNNLDSADFLKKIPNAATIDLHDNNISNLYKVRDIVLKKGISDSRWKSNTINIADNPLDVPNMQVVTQGMDAVARFFSQYEAEQSVYVPLYKNDDIKIILVGNSDAGKSSLAERLITNKWNDQLPTTHWMEIKKWEPVRKGRKYKIRIFDFGGQEYYHDTHYLFFSNQTAYVLLWNQKTNNYDECEIHQLQKDKSKKPMSIQGFPIPYWMESIAYHCKRKIGSEEASLYKILQDFDQFKKSANIQNNPALIGTPAYELDLSAQKELIRGVMHPPNIIITQNKIATAKDLQFLNQSQLKSDYPTIYEFANISAKTGRGMDHFKDLLFEMIDTMPISTRECLGTWGAIKVAIENGVADNQREMSLKEFRLYCNHIISEMPEVQNAGNKSTEALYFSIADSQSYAHYLNDIGLILYFPDNEHLKDKVFVKQDDVLKKIYNILEGLHALSGKFNNEHIIKVLKKKKFDEECTTIIELMKHFKIAFPHPSQEETFIAPLYLPALPSKSISIFLDDGHQPSYRFLFHGFIHKHIILEFFHLYGQQALRDEHGQQYYYWKNGIVIKDDLTHGIVMVRFINATATEKAYIDVYSLSKSGDKSLLKKITAELERLTLDMNVKKAVTANGTDFVPVDVIHAAEASNQWTFHYNDHLFDLKVFRAHLKNELKMKKIFISYSKADAHYLQQLENHLSALKRNGSISTWNCRQLLPGEKWDGKIKNELEEADIIIFLVSSDFLATDYIWDIEIKRAIERENANPDTVKVVPIIIRSCLWEDTPLSAYNTAPKKAQVITLSANLDEAFTDAVRDLKKIL